MINFYYSVYSISNIFLVFGKKFVSVLILSFEEGEKWERMVLCVSNKNLILDKLVFFIIFMIKIVF